MTGRIILHVWFVVCSTGLLALCSPGGSDLSFDAALGECDRFLDAGALGAAGIALASAEKFAGGREDHLRILRRHLSIARSSGSWRSFTEAATRAFDRYPGHGDFAVLMTYGTLRRGDSGRAATLSREYLRNGVFDSLKDEIWIRTATADGTISDDGRLVSRSWIPSFGADEAELLFDAGNRFGDSRFHVDAALVYAGAGRLTEAATTISTASEDEPYLAALIRYDAGDHLGAAASIEQAIAEDADTFTETDRLVAADILGAAGKRDEAAGIYRTIVSGAADSDSWIPFVNLSRYVRTAGEIDEAARIIEQGIATFGSNAAFLTERVMISLALDDTDGIDEAFTELAREEGEDAFMVDLLSYLAGRTEGVSRRAESAVREAFFRSPSDESLALLAMKLLLTSGNFADARQTLSVYLASAPPTEGTDFFAGVIAVHDGTIDSAIEHFEAASSRSMRWEHRYNLGLACAAAGRYAASRDALRSATPLAPDAAASAKIALAIAETFLLSGDVDSARREAAYAVDLAADLTEARLFLDTIVDR
jgi:tetratricopeptide (TPR) repeat protein